MGMYDTINGEQVKCFFWVHYYNPSKEKGCHLTTSGGNLDIFHDGDEIPYKTNSYNYTKDFIILDGHFRYNTHRCPKCGEESYNGETICSACNTKMKKSPAIIHIIRDRRVKETIYLYEEDKHSKELEEKLFKKNNKVISYFGEEMNIHSLEDIFLCLEHMKIYFQAVQNSFEKTNYIREKVTKELRKKQKKDTTYSEKNYNKYISEYEKAIEEKEKELDKLKIEHIHPFYFPETNEQTFGQYLDALYEYEQRESKENEYKQLKKEFLDFYKEDYLEKFFKYMNSTKEEKIEIIETVKKYKREE